MNLNPDQFNQDYRGGHQPSPSGAPMHDVEHAFPGIHEKPRIYDFGEPGAQEAIRHIQRVKGNPDATVTIHRAVPHGVTDINHGDWVTPSKAYARQHAMQSDNPKEDWPVISKKVRAADLRTDGDSVNEFGYFPTKGTPEKWEGFK